MGIAKKTKTSKTEEQCDPGSVVGVVPMSMPKSGRKWKVMNNERSSAQHRKGVLGFMSTSYEEKKLAKEKKDRIKQLEQDMVDEKKAQIAEKRRLAEERKKRVAANAYKSSVYQVLNTETMKGMSKKQLRQVKKTTVNKQGQVELVDLYNANGHNAKRILKGKK